MIKRIIIMIQNDNIIRQNNNIKLILCSNKSLILNEVELIAYMLN